LGYGHGDPWWREFCYRFRLNGYDGWLSIEHEDIILSRMEIDGAAQANLG